MSRIFINYRRQDTEGYVGRLYDHLVKHFESDDIFMDVANISPGANFVTVLEEAVARCDVFIAMIGPHWLTINDDTGTRRIDQEDDFVRIEIASALKQQKMVIPVLVGKAPMPPSAMLPDDLKELSRRNAIELSHNRFGYDADNLVEAIRTAIPANASVKRGSSPEVLEQKEAALKIVRDDLIRATTSPLYSYRIQNAYFPVIGEGNPDANIIFIGESPGKTEAEDGRPFVGPSGEVLAEMLATIKLKRTDVYITNVLLDRPPDQHEPTPVEIAYYTPFLDRIIDIIQPAVIVTLGRFAMEYILKKFSLPEKGGKISQLHGKLLRATAHHGEIHILPLYHPAVVLYSATQKSTLRRDFQRLKIFI